MAVRNHEPVLAGERGDRAQGTVDVQLLRLLGVIADERIPVDRHDD